LIYIQKTSKENNSIMKKKIHNFDSFVRSEYPVNENFFSNLMTKSKDYVQTIKEMIRKGIIKMIPSGPKKGTPVVTIFDPDDGNILDQIDALYSGTEFAKMNPLTKTDQLEISGKLTEAVVGTESPYPVGVADYSAAEITEAIVEYYVSLINNNGDRSKANYPIFIYGAPGIGKTQIVGAAAERLGIKLLNLDLQFMAPEDLRGIPSVVELDPEEIQQILRDQNKPVGSPEGRELDNLEKYGAGVTVSNPPAILPRDNMANNKGGIIFLDEANRATTTVLNSLMNFVQQGRIGSEEEYMLPGKWIIVAAGNRRVEASGVAAFDLALSDRFDIMNFRPDPEDWVEYTKELRKTGGKHGKDMYRKWPLEIINYIHKNTEWFHRLDPDKLEAEAQGMGGKFPTPRSWVAAMNQIRNECMIEGVDSWRELPLEVVLTIIRDNVGEEALKGIQGSKLGGLGNYLTGLYKIKPQQMRLMYNQPENSSLKIQADETELEIILYGLFLMMIDQVEGDDQAPPPEELKKNMIKYFSQYRGKNAGIDKALKEIFDKIKELYPDK